MCLDPASLISLGLGAAGQAISGSEAAANNKRMVEARNAATQAELDRQHAFQDQSTGVFNTALNTFSPDAQAASLAGNQGVARAFLASNGPTAANVGTIGIGPASAATGTNAARTIADAITKNTTNAENLGNLRGWDLTNQDNGITLAGSGRGIGTISDLAANSARVGQLEQTVNANNAYRPSSGLGDLLTFAGNYAAYKGGTGINMPTKSIFI